MKTKSRVWKYLANQINQTKILTEFPKFFTRKTREIFGERREKRAFTILPRFI